MMDSSRIENDLVSEIKLEPIQAGDVPRTFANVQSLFDYIKFSICYSKSGF